MITYAVAKTSIILPPPSQKLLQYYIRRRKNLCMILWVMSWNKSNHFCLARPPLAALIKTHWTIVFIANDKEFDFIAILVIASCLICNFPVVGIPQILILKFNEEDLQYVYKLFFCVFYRKVRICFDRISFPLLIKPA